MIASRVLEDGPENMRAVCLLAFNVMLFACGAVHETILAPSKSECPLEIHMREDGDNNAQSEQMPSAQALVLNCTQSTLVHYS